MVAVAVAFAGGLVACGSGGGGNAAKPDLGTFCQRWGKIGVGDKFPTDAQVDAVAEAAPTEIRNVVQSFVDQTKGIRAGRALANQAWFNRRASIQAYYEKNCPGAGTSPLATPSSSG